MTNEERWKDLRYTMWLVEHPTFWLEAEDPEKCRQDLVDLAEYEFGEWLDTFRGVAA